MAWGAVGEHRGREGPPQTHEGPPEAVVMGAAEAAAGVVVAAAAVAAAQAELVTVGAGHCASFLCQRSCNTHTHTQWIRLVLDSFTEKFDYTGQQRHHYLRIPSRSATGPGAARSHRWSWVAFEKRKTAFSVRTSIFSYCC